MAENGDQLPTGDPVRPETLRLQGNEPEAEQNQQVDHKDIQSVSYTHLTLPTSDLV